MPAIALAIRMPIAVSLQKSRRTAFLTALGYYAGASWPLMPGAKAFFGPNATWLESALLWLTSSFLLALPFGIFWTGSIRMRPLRNISGFDSSYGASNRCDWLGIPADRRRGAISWNGLAGFSCDILSLFISLSFSSSFGYNASSNFRDRKR